MNHLGTVNLETKRLRLRRFKAEDAEAMFHHWAKDPEVTKFLTWPAHQDVSGSSGYIAWVLERYQNPDTYDWGIELKEISQVIGSIGAVSLNQTLSSVQIGYCIGKPWWGNGIMTEALGEIIRFFMEEVGINRIEARHDTKNMASGKVMKHCGLTLEGILRQSDQNNQGICDAAWYALLREEYQK